MTRYTYLARHDNLPPGCLSKHLNRILGQPGGVKTAHRERQADGVQVVTLWFIAYALATIGVCVWLLLRAVVTI